MRGNPLAVGVLLAAGADARWSHDNKGKKQHRDNQQPRPHKFLSFCGNDEYVYPVSCKFQAKTKWPQRVDGFTYLTYPHCEPLDSTHFSGGTNNVFKACSLTAQTAPEDAYLNTEAASTDTSTGTTSIATRNPLTWPLKTTAPGLYTAPSTSEDVNVFQPVVVPIGERESNPHHLAWPDSRYPSCYVSSTNSFSACACHPDCHALTTLDTLRKKALLVGKAWGDSQILRMADPSWDPHTIDVWDRLEIRDGQIMSTIFHVKYTPMECARLCSKMTSFRNNQCIAFSRKWMKTERDEHHDCAGRDGDVGCDVLDNMRPGYGGNWGYSSHVTYKYPGQCVFFGKMFDDSSSGGTTSTDLTVTNLCTTVEDWLLDKTGKPYNSETAANIEADKNSCKYRHGAATNNWKAKTRSWRMIGPTSSGNPQLASRVFTPTSAAIWPVQTTTTTTPVQEGRRLSVNETGVHEFILPNGTHFWSEE